MCNLHIYLFAYSYNVKVLLEWSCIKSILFLTLSCSLSQVSHVLAALQAGNRGTQACITAASAVAGIIADLDTTIMFATAGTLNRENAETFADHRFPNIRDLPKHLDS